MAVAFNLTDGLFPIGTSVAAYPVSNWTNGIIDTSAVPLGSATETQTVDAGTATTAPVGAFVALAASTSYVAYASVGGRKRYVRFHTDAS